MGRRKTRKKLAYYSLNIFLISIMALASVFLVRASWLAYHRYAFAKEKAERESQRLKLSKEHEAELKEKLSELKSDFGVEKILRENYSYALPGEKLLLIIDEADTGEEAEAEDRIPWWSFRNLWPMRD